MLGANMQTACKPHANMHAARYKGHANLMHILTVHVLIEYIHTLPGGTHVDKMLIQ